MKYPMWYNPVILYPGDRLIEFIHHDSVSRPNPKVIQDMSIFDKKR